MSRKSSIEAKIVEYFQMADPIRAELVLGIIKNEMKRRAPRTLLAQTRKPRVAKENMVTVNSVPIV